MSSPALERAAARDMTEAQYREIRAREYEAEAEFWIEARDRQTFGPHTDYDNRIADARRVANRLRESNQFTALVRKP